MVLRKITLSFYAPDSKLGFTIARWVALCDKYNDKENDYLIEMNSELGMIPCVTWFHQFMD